MAFTWVTAEKGIRYREHESRKHGVKPDRYFTLRFYVEGKRVEEALGWASDGWTLEKARRQLGQLKEAKRTGEGETTLREKRQVAIAARELEQQNTAAEIRRNVTLRTYFDNQYKPWREATSPKEFKNDECRWRIWIDPTLGELPVNSIGLEQWDLLMKSMSAAELSQRSREYVAGVLRRILKHARERQVVTDAPPTGKMIGATSPKDNRRERVLTDKELQALLAALQARDVCAWRVTMFAAGTGCRAGEAYGLKWSGLDLKEGSATFLKTKNGKARKVPLGKEVRAMLKALPTGRSQDPVFLDHLGKPYTQAPVSFRDVVETLKLNEGRADNDRFTFHSLRHMAATRLARVLPLRGLMDVLGWEVAAMALRYSHTSDADRNVAAQALDAAFRPTGKVVSMRKRGGA